MHRSSNRSNNTVEDDRLKGQGFLNIPKVKTHYEPKKRSKRSYNQAPDQLNKQLNDSYARAKAQRAEPPEKDFRPSIARPSNVRTSQLRRRTSSIFDDVDLDKPKNGTENRFGYEEKRLYQSEANPRHNAFGETGMRGFNRGEEDMKMSNLLEYNKLSRTIGKKQSMLFRNAEVLREDQKLTIDIFDSNKEAGWESGLQSRNDPKANGLLAQKMGASPSQDNFGEEGYTSNQMGGMDAQMGAFHKSRIRNQRDQVQVKQNGMAQGGYVNINNSGSTSAYPGSRLEQMMGYGMFSNPSIAQSNLMSGDSAATSFNLKQDMFSTGDQLRNDNETGADRPGQFIKSFKRRTTLLNESMTPQALEEEAIIQRQIVRVPKEDLKREKQRVMDGVSEEQVIQEILEQNKELGWLKKELFNMEKHPDNVVIKREKLDRLQAQEVDLSSKLKGLRAQVTAERRESKEIARDYHNIVRRLDKLDEIETEERARKIKTLKKLDRRCAQLQGELEHADEDMAKRREYFQSKRDEIVERETKQLKEILQEDEGDYLKYQIQKMIRNYEEEKV